MPFLKFVLRIQNQTVQFVALETEATAERLALTLTITALPGVKRLGTAFLARLPFGIGRRTLIVLPTQRRIELVGFCFGLSRGNQLLLQIRKRLLQRVHAQRTRQADAFAIHLRSEERRVGKECRS